MCAARSGRHAGELPPGLDGEILTYDSQANLFNKQEAIDITTRPREFYGIQSDVMSFDGTPTFRFLVFDCRVLQPGPIGLQEIASLRAKYLADLILPDFCIKVTHRMCSTPEELLDYNDHCLAMGYEGCCFRWPQGPAWKMKSKDGRSTLREQYLVKMKLFDKGEAVIIGSYEEMANNNPITLGLKGNAERSSHKANMSGKGTLGGFLVKDVETGNEFGVGGGFTAAQRLDFWERQESLVGEILQYVHQPHGRKDAPRIGIFKGFRDRKDMSITQQ